MTNNSKVRDRELVELLQQLIANFCLNDVTDASGCQREHAVRGPGGLQL
jgi:hypothetical protein